MRECVEDVLWKVLWGLNSAKPFHGFQFCISGLLVLVCHLVGDFQACMPADLLGYLWIPEAGCEVSYADVLRVLCSHQSSFAVIDWPHPWTRWYCEVAGRRLSDIDTRLGGVIDGFEEPVRVPRLASGR